jgi:rhamnosyltransferase
MSKVCAIIVTYNTTLSSLLRVLRSICFQVDRVILVNNDANEFLPFLKEFGNIFEYALGENFGIGYAQNFGIKLAINDKFGYVLLSDQDSIYPDNYVKRMLLGCSVNPEIGAIAPAFVDLNVDNGEPSFVFSMGPLFVTRKVTEGTYDIFHAIASGLLIKTVALIEVGLMNEELFIDWVDLEWCWRLRSAGFRLIGDSSVSIDHILGDRSLNIGFRNVPIRSHIRHYYITRNAFHLALRTPYLSRAQRLVLGARSMKYLIGFPILGGENLLNFRYVFLGLFHGIVGRLGRVY